MFAETPQMSVRKLVNSIIENATCSSSSVYRMLRFDIKLTSYTISIMQHLKPSVSDYRIQFGRWMIEHDKIIENVSFSGEAHFYLNGDMHFVKLKPMFWVTFLHHTNNSLWRIMFIIKSYYFRALFVRRRHFENMCFNYDVILNVIDVAFSQI